MSINASTRHLCLKIWCPCDSDFGKRIEESMKTVFIGLKTVNRLNLHYYIHRLTLVFCLSESLCDSMISIQAVNIPLHIATTNAVTDVAHFSSVRGG